MTTLSAAILIFLVLDPLGNIPIFVSILRRYDVAKQREIIIRESLIALGVLILFLFSGQYLLTLMHIDQSSLGIAGGIILFIIALKMIFTGAADVFSTSDYDEPLIVPLAIPSIAGPSAMATVMLLMARDPAHWLHWLIALVTAWLLTFVILYFCNQLSSLLGKKGMVAIERLMGMLLTAVAVQMFINGMKEAFTGIN
ncbi:MAG: MarC family protein [bacterium]|jgi:multiple antibiotic resistance protein